MKPPVKKGFLLALGEIFLKSEGVQRLLRKRLVNNLSFFLKKEGVEFKIFPLRERIFIGSGKVTSEVCEGTSPRWKEKKTTVSSTAEVEGKAADVLKNTFGLVWFAKTFFLEKATIGDLANFIKVNYRDWIKKNESFALRLTRGGVIQKKREAIINKIAAEINRKVKLDHPQKEIFLEARKNGWFVYLKKQKGPGGLPAGSQGKVLSLISGGIDSPAAAWLMAKRGAENVWLHFHSFPLVSKASLEKTKELARTFLNYQPKLKIYFVPFFEIQIKIKTSTPPKYRVLLYRRLMLQIAQEIAEKERCQALVTGESLGQVSSQTLPNLQITQEGISLLVLRPLIGLDKEEIISLAKKIKTYDISIQPQEDCCTLFVPKHQTAAGNLEDILRLEKELKPDKLISKIVSKAEVESY